MNATRALTLAKRQAEKSKYFKQIGVVFVRGSKILAKGFNRISHAQSLKWRGIDGYIYYSLHAEIDAMFRAGNVKGSTVYLYGIKHGRPAGAKPCPLCERYLKIHGVEKAIYTTALEGIKEVTL